MPPLNHRMNGVERSGSVYTVGVTEQNAGPGGNSTFKRDTHFVESFEGAVRVALHEVEGQPLVREMGTGMMYLYEPHDDEEKYTQAVIRERRVFSLR